MQDVYFFVAGPMLWLAAAVFFGGCAFRLAALLIQIRRKEAFIFSYLSLRYGLRSILRWMTPFATVNWRRHPLLTVVVFVFHICLVVTPLFLGAHVILFDAAWNFSWGALPDRWADIMTLTVMGSVVFFAVRRIKAAEVRYVTSVADYVLLGLVAAPFVTGFVAYHQWFQYQLFLVLHIVSGELMLAAIPFTRLSHMLFALLTRAYTGSEFGAVRHARDW